MPRKQTQAAAADEWSQAATVSRSRARPSDSALRCTGNTVYITFKVDEQGKLSPSLTEYTTVCEHPIYHARFLEISLSKWEWPGTFTDPQIQGTVKEICGVLNYSLQQPARLKSVLLDARFLKGAQYNQLLDAPPGNGTRLKQLSIVNFDSLVDQTIMRRLFTIIGPNFWGSVLSIDGRVQRWAGQEGGYIMGLHPQFMGLTTLKLSKVTVWDWLHLAKDLHSLAHVTITDMCDSGDDPRIAFIGVRNFDSLDLSVGAGEALDRKILMRALRPLRSHRLKKLSLSNDYLWSRSSMSEFLSEMTHLEEFRANNMPGLTPDVLVDFLRLDAVDGSLKTLHINPGPLARFKLFDPRHALVEQMGTLGYLQALETISFPLEHIVYPNTNPQQTSPIMLALSLRTVESGLKCIKLSTTNPKAIKTTLSDANYNFLKHLQRQKNVEVRITDDPYDF